MRHLLGRLGGPQDGKATAQKTEVLHKWAELRTKSLCYCCPGYATRLYRQVKSESTWIMVAGVGRKHAGQNWGQQVGQSSQIEVLVRWC